MPSLYGLRPPVAKAAPYSPPPLAAVAPSQTSENAQQSFFSRSTRLPLGLPPALKRETQALACPIRSTLVTDSLTKTVRAKLHNTGIPDGEPPAHNYGSSGSAHEPSSVCLAAMVHEFLEDDHVDSCGRARCNCVNGTCSGEGRLTSDSDNALPTPGDDELRETMKELVTCTDATESGLLVYVSKAVDAFICNGEGEDAYSSNDWLLRWVMKHLRLVGYNAAVCKSRWEHTGGFPAGDYEYIDLITGETADRLIVDTNFRAQFEIARASSHYNALLQILPCIFVGSTERLEQILKIMSEATKLSLKKMGMPLPPWRRHWYIRAKWFSSYKRTTKEFSQSHRNSEETLSREFAAIALKGSQFCDRFKEEVERFYQRGSGGRAVVQESSPLGSSTCAKTDVYDTPKKQSDVITVMSTNWELPPLKPRNITGSGGVSGLANAFQKDAPSLPKLNFACKPSLNRQQARRMRSEPAACS